ncbi:MAG: tetratricopeptide repeat protein [Nitrospirae bacterium]|nr:MAG: tetratricopeptide repeat protein [Nitrospirota bacterium]
MGKDKILDASDKEKVKSLKLRVTKGFISEVSFPLVGNPSEERLRTSRSDKQRYHIYGLSKRVKIIFCLIAFSLLTSCSLPRIIILEDPLTPEEHINLGVAYEKSGELDNALKEYKEASKKLPSAYLYMGNIYFQKNELAEAEYYYKKAIKKGPQNADAYNNLAWLYYTKKENLDEAESLALKAIELNPSKKDGYQDTIEKIRGVKSKL